MKKKHKIILGIVLGIYVLWLAYGPKFISDHFHEVGEESLYKIQTNTLTENAKAKGKFSLDEFLVRENSYREVVELSGFAFNELKMDERKRDIRFRLVSAEECYELKTMQWDRPETIIHFYPDLNPKYLQPVGFLSKFSAIKLKNLDYQVFIIIEEDGKLSYYDTEILLKKKMGIVMIERNKE